MARRTSTRGMGAIESSSLLFFLLPVSLAQLQLGFYATSCPKAESIIRQVVETRFADDPSITPALLRMHFHDCLVRGCDASLLIDPTPTRPSEKDAGPNLSVRGFEIIDEIKSNLEAVCPNNVSCADILALATRDSVALAGGPLYSLPTGRRDGFTSDPNDVGLPGPTIPVPLGFDFFRAKGMTITDYVALLGAHTVGFTRCDAFQDRLSDGSMDPRLASRLRSTCAAPTNPVVFLDQGTPGRIDNELYRQILRRRGILKLDQDLASDPLTRPVVESFASDNAVFLRRFAEAMVKMGSVDVLTGSDGDVRTNCRVFNSD